MDNNVIMELIGCAAIIVFFFWWLLTTLYRTALIGIIYWRNGDIEEVNIPFDNLDQYDEWVEQMFEKYPNEIHHIEYEFINPKYKR